MKAEKSQRAKKILEPASVIWEHIFEI